MSQMTEVTFEGVVTIKGTFTLADGSKKRSRSKSKDKAQGSPPAKKAQSLSEVLLAHLDHVNTKDEVDDHSACETTDDSDVGIDDIDKEEGAKNEGDKGDVTAEDEYDSSSQAEESATEETKKDSKGPKEISSALLQDDNWTRNSDRYAKKIDGIVKRFEAEGLKNKDKTDEELDDILPEETGGRYAYILTKDVQYEDNLLESEKSGYMIDAKTGKLMKILSKEDGQIIAEENAGEEDNDGNGSDNE